MSKSSARWQSLLAVLVATVMVLALFAPSIAEAKPSNLPNGIQGKPIKAVNVGVSQRLSTLAKRVQVSQTAPEGLTQDLANGPYMETLGGFKLPHETYGHIRFMRPPESEAKPGIEPDKKVYDDPVPSVDVGWNGIGQSSNRTIFGFGVYPPDTTGDVSDTHYIQIVNMQFSVWDLTQAHPYMGTYPYNVLPPMPLSVLFRGWTSSVCSIADDGDPLAVYDEHADRWILSQFALPYYPYGPFSECIAVSATSDPLGAWYLYEFQFNKMNDYPKMGIMEDAYYLTFNQFQYLGGSSLSWGGQGVVTMDRADMLAGSAAPDAFYWDLYGYDPNLGGMLPADTDGPFAPAGTPGIVMEADDDAWGFPQDQLQYFEIVNDFAGNTATMYGPNTLAVNAFDSEVCPDYTRNCIPQPGTTVGLDAISDRLMYRLQYRNFGSHQTMVVNHTVDVANVAYPGYGQAGIRWYELRDYGGGWYVFQQGDYAPTTDHRWMGSIAMDAFGNIALGYSISNGTSLYPNMAYAGRHQADPLGTLPLTEALMINTTTAAGSQTGTGYRWGDYSNMALGPDGCTFVYTNEYLRGTTPVEWYTMIAMFDFDDACYRLETHTFESQGAYDGFVIESLETSGVGGMANAISPVMYIGDYIGDKQVLDILSFDTSALPDTAVVTGARIEMRLQNYMGTNPFTTHGPLLVDLARPYFGAAATLATTDFQDPATNYNVATCATAPTGGWLGCDLTSGFANFNNTGTTQFRVYFTLDDNDDLGADLALFYSGNALPGYRPVLVVTYYVP